MKPLYKIISITVALAVISSPLYAARSSNKKQDEKSTLLTTYLTKNQFEKIVKNAPFLVKKSRAKVNKNQKMKKSLAKWNDKYLVFSDKKKCLKSKKIYELFVYYPKKIVTSKKVKPPVMLVCADSTREADSFAEIIQKGSKEKIIILGKFATLSQKKSSDLAKLFGD